MLEAAAEALLIISDPNRLMFVALGTLWANDWCYPRIGGLVGLALLLSFPTHIRLAFLVGVQSVPQHRTLYQLFVWRSRHNRIRSNRVRRLPNGEKW